MQAKQQEIKLKRASNPCVCLILKKKKQLPIFQWKNVLRLPNHRATSGFKTLDHYLINGKYASLSFKKFGNEGSIETIAIRLRHNQYP